MKNYGADDLTGIHSEISQAFGRIFFFKKNPLLGVSVVYTVAVWAEKLHGPFTKCEMSILCYFGFAQL